MMAAYSAIWILFPLIKKNVRVGPPLAKLSGPALEGDRELLLVVDIEVEVVKDL